MYIWYGMYISLGSRHICSWTVFHNDWNIFWTICNGRIFTYPMAKMEKVWILTHNNMELSYSLQKILKAIKKLTFQNFSLPIDCHCSNSYSNLSRNNCWCNFNQWLYEYCNVFSFTICYHSYHYFYIIQVNSKN